MKLYKLALHKSYFVKGHSVLNYAKYMIVFFGFASRDVRTTLMFGIAYAVICYFFGMYLYKVGYAEAEREVENQYDRFAKEVRHHIKNGKV